MVWWWDRSRRGRAGGSRAGFEPTVPSTPPTTGYFDSGRSRYEVCPPALVEDDGFDLPRSGVRSLFPPLTSIRQWLQTGWYSTDQPGHRPPVAAIARTHADKQLDAARAAFAAALADVPTAAAAELRNRARAAHTLRELWHLRNPLFTAVSIGHCESIARERLTELNLHFPIREQGKVRRAIPERAPGASCQRVG
ncbi:MAG: hypothetical protein ABI564_12680 [Ideonella sp.]